MMANQQQVLQQLCVIVDCGKGSKVMHKAKKTGVFGATVLLGKGTAKNRFLDFLSLTEMRKEIVLMVADQERIDQALRELDRVMHLSRPNHGIAFVTNICFIGGAHQYPCHLDDLRKGADEAMYQAITVIVDKGRAEAVVAAATRVGAKGGTIINARGSGIHETSRLFGMDIEPEKEMVLILSVRDKSADIIEAIRQDLKIDEPGNGIIFVQSVSQIVGLSE